MEDPDAPDSPPTDRDACTDKAVGASVALAFSAAKLTRRGAFSPAFGRTNRIGSPADTPRVTTSEIAAAIPKARAVPDLDLESDPIPIPQDEAIELIT
jgi:hypothetical protein